jgi:hypothetical protein
MWAYEHSVETTVAAAAIWRLWADVASWGRWNKDIEAVELRGSFAEGSTISMTPAGQDAVQLRLAEVRENELFVDEAEFAGVLLRTAHRLEQLDERRVRVTYRMEITGSSADDLGPQIGPQITADFPETMAALVERAGA